MFRAELISLSRGQSYRDVDIIEWKDFDNLEIPKLFGRQTIAFFHNHKLIICHPWGVRVIWLDRNSKRRGGKAMYFEKIVLDGDISYGPGYIIDDDDYTAVDVPDIFEDPEEVIDQVTFSCSDGTIITHNANIVSVIMGYPRRAGINAAENVDNASITDQVFDDQMVGKIRNRAKR